MERDENFAGIISVRLEVGKDAITGGVDTTFCLVNLRYCGLKRRRRPIRLFDGNEFRGDPCGASRRCRSLAGGVERVSRLGHCSRSGTGLRLRDGEAFRKLRSVDLRQA